MDKVRLQTPKGFRDFLPPEAIKRQLVVGKIIKVFERFGFDPLETPALEYAETFRGKYGEEEKLIYEFTTRGGDRVALKYDQTVPLARVVAQYQNLPKPFKRYQIQPAYRGENPQKGRYREFLQCDADIIGLSTPLADAEILALACEIYTSLGLDIIIKVNDRGLLQEIEPKYLSAIDKLNKIGKQGVLDELVKKGLTVEQAEEMVGKMQNLKTTANLEEVMALFGKMGYPASSLQFDPALVRGLDYYTGIIMEVVLAQNPVSSSLGGGGRWDKMIGQFTGQPLPAVGFSVGLDRTIEALEQTGVLTAPLANSQVLVTIFSADLLNKSLQTLTVLRSNKIPSEIWLDPAAKLDKQLRYADQKGIPYVVIIGPEEAAKGEVTLKNLSTKSQEKVAIDGLPQKLSS